LRDTGHRRVPEPPHRIIGWIKGALPLLSGANEHVCGHQINAAPMRPWHDIAVSGQGSCLNPAPEMRAIRHRIPFAMTTTQA
jgi:hypothetical protein